MDEKCENCKYFKCFSPTDAKSDGYDGICENPPKKPKWTPFPSWPKVSRNKKACGLFLQGPK